MPIEIETTRLLLRQWHPSDYPAFAKMNADPEVMHHFPQCLNTRQSNALADKFYQLIEEQSWGFWALELKCSRQFIDFTGLHYQPQQFSFSPCTEVGWRLAQAYWGKGYATEAALACLVFAFQHLNLAEVVSFTAVNNIKSQAVMQRLNMNIVGYFDHPALDRHHALAPHILYSLKQADFPGNHDVHGLSQSIHIAQV
ncbi:GNAT family N-acetyltransferase [Acinetobacter bohemicus]|uniref:GNAT family N-acetyltransferase n=1 Tax=Acinetobacter sp. S4397-1 TaxID=2972915 RepID=UPI00209AD245|nr:GNAT family N-acetyltransferase [Acinetobacter sp. S4397-1]MCO8044689.1 GNAT family N-acetyltransferase [Acinetobacter sp. S4397-1]